MEWDFHAKKHAVFTRISAAALINFSRHKSGAYSRAALISGGTCLKIVPDKFTFSTYLFNGTLSTLGFMQ